MVAIIETDDRCGPQCGYIRSALHTVEEKSDGAIRSAYAHIGDTILNADGEPVLTHAAFNISTTPSILIFPAGKKGSAHFIHPMKLEGQNAVDILSHGPRLLFENSKLFVPSLVAAARTRDFADFIGRPSPLLPRVVLFTDAGATDGGSSAPLPIKRLSVDFAARAHIGLARNDDTALVAAFRSNTTRRLFVGPSAASAGSSAELVLSGSTPTPGSLAGWTAYDSVAGGGMGYTAIRRWLQATLPPAPLPQLRSQADFDRHCGAGTSSVCFIAVLPASAEREAYEEGEGAAEDAEDGPSPLSVFRRIASSNYVQPDWASISTGRFVAERLPGTFVWVNSDAQSDFLEAFDALSPGLIALNPRKKVFAVLKQSYSERNIDEFVFGMMNYRPDGVSPFIGTDSARRVDLQPIKTLPKLERQPPPPEKKNKAPATPGAPKKKRAVKKPAAAPTAAPAAEAEEDKVEL
jgi:hypothetical protein